MYKTNPVVGVQSHRNDPEAQLRWRLANGQSPDATKGPVAPAGGEQRWLVTYRKRHLGVYPGTEIGYSRAVLRRLEAEEADGQYGYDALERDARVAALQALADSDAPSAPAAAAMLRRRFHVDHKKGVAPPGATL